MTVQWHKMEGRSPQGSASKSALSGEAEPGKGRDGEEHRGCMERRTRAKQCTGASVGTTPDPRQPRRKGKPLCITLDLRFRMDTKPDLFDLELVKTLDQRRGKMQLHHFQVVGVPLFSASQEVETESLCSLTT